MLSALVGLLPFAVGVIISPVPIIAAIIVATSRRRFSTGPAFLAGWFVGLLGLMILFSELGATFGRDGPPVFVHVVGLVLGFFLWWLAWKEWRDRDKKEMPAWLESVDELKAYNAFVFGLALATIVNPKNIPLTVAAGTVVARSGIGFGGALVVAIVFSVIASLSIALSVGLPLTEVGGRFMDRFRDWLQRRTTMIMVPLFVLIGTVLIVTSILGISAN